MRRSRTGARYVEVRLADLNLHRQGRTILEHVNWTVRPGQRWVLAGANGAGKTQLLKTLAGDVWPDTQAGSRRVIRSYRWRGETYRSPFEVKEEVAYLGPERQDKYERYGWNHPVMEIIATGLYRTDIPLNPLSDADRRRVAVLLRRLGIIELTDRAFLTLSYGQRRLVLLARALASRPGLLLLDELLSGLDTCNREQALRWLQLTGRSALPWVLAAHRAEDVPDSASHALVLESGRVVYQGPVRGAAVAKWLVDEPYPIAAARAPRARTVRGGTRRSRMLLRLTNASVYVDEQHVLQGLSFEVRAGDCWVVHGPNGSGKTTLLRTLYADHGVASGGRIERAGIQKGVPLQLFKQRVGLVAPHLQADHPQDLLVEAVVQSGRYASVGLNQAPTAADRTAARRSLAFFGLTPLTTRTLRDLSYGQLRRVLFARAWVCRPALLLLDEPFAGVDGPARLELMAHVDAMLAQGAAVVLGTHHRGEWPAGTSHEIELRAGRAVYCGRLRLAAAGSGTPGGEMK